MSDNHHTPTTARARTVYFFWRNLPRFFLLGLVGLIIFLSMFIGREGERLAAEKAAAPAPQPPVVNVVVMQALPVSIQDRINLPGMIEPWKELDLKIRVSGTVVEVSVAEGDLVKKGDVLVRIDADDYQISLDSATAAYDFASSDYKRDSAVYGKGVIPTATLELKKSRLAAGRASMEHARLQLERCGLVSPMDGVVSRMHVELGDLLSVADPVAVLLQLDRVKAVVGIPESDVVAVRKINLVPVTVQALGDRLYNGIADFLSPIPESNARLYRLEVTLDNPEGEILPGMFVRADLVKETVDNALIVPLYAVISRNDEQFVFVAENGVARKHPVQLGILEKWQVQITTGIDPGDLIVVEGHRAVEDGQVIKVVRQLENSSGLIPQ